MPGRWFAQLSSKSPLRPLRWTPPLGKGRKENGDMKKNTVLCIDIGNTSITVGCFKNGKLEKTFRIPTKEFKKTAIRTIQSALNLKNVEAAVIASVVPLAGKFLRAELPKKLKLKTFLIGQDLTPPIRNRYKNPKQVGMDRLMSAVAVYEKYRKNAIVIDFGTAITFDAVTQKGEYLGGVIAPGIEISLDALFERTALLPRIRLARPKSILGRDTIESIQSGCSYGIGGLCDRIVLELQKKLGKNTLVIATGGYARFMSRYCRSIWKIDDDLVLRGILLTYRASV